MSTKLLEVKNLVVKFGGVTALDNVDLHVNQGEIAALIGPNGAGKTTVFNIVTGYYTPAEGEILVDGKSMLGLRPYKIARAGLARTFQNIRLFGDMTAVENVATAADALNKSGLVGSLFGVPRSRRDEKTSMEKAHELLKFMLISLLPRSWSSANTNVAVARIRRQASLAIATCSSFSQGTHFTSDHLIQRSRVVM